MKKQKKQNILTVIIIILVLALIMMIGSIVYEEKINMSKQQTQNTNAPAVENEETDTIIDEEELPVETDNDEETYEETYEQSTTEKEEYVGEEESDIEEDTTQSKDEKVINLVKKEWGDDDSVTFSIVQKKGTKYYVAVKSQDTETTWYEVDTETWKVSEY